MKAGREEVALWDVSGAFLLVLCMKYQVEVVEVEHCEYALNSHLIVFIIFKG